MDISTLEYPLIFDTYAVYQYMIYVRMIYQKHVQEQNNLALSVTNFSRKIDDSPSRAILVTDFILYLSKSLYRLELARPQ